MSIESTLKDNIALLGQGALQAGMSHLPAVIHLDVTEIVHEARVYIGHIEDKIKNGERTVFGVSDQNLLCAALVLASDLRAATVEVELMTADLISCAEDNESLVDVQAIVTAITDATKAITKKLSEYNLYDGDLLNYVFGRYKNGQLELVRKSIDDPNITSAQLGFTMPAWTTAQLKR